MRGQHGHHDAGQVEQHETGSADAQLGQDAFGGAAEEVQRDHVEGQVQRTEVQRPTADVKRP
jgi:hypothetical protein